MTTRSKLTPAAALDVSGVAALLGIAPRTVRKLDKNGSLPKPVLIGETEIKRWNRRELLDWLTAGAPPRDCWTWFPTTAWSLTDYCRQQHKELARLREEITEAEEQLRRLTDRI